MTFPIFTKVGGEDAALEIISRSLGKEPTKFARDKWRSFGILPAKIAQPLLLEAIRKGIDADDTDLSWSEPAEAEE